VIGHEGGKKRLQRGREVGATRKSLGVTHGSMNGRIRERDRRVKGVFGGTWKRGSSKEGESSDNARLVSGIGADAWRINSCKLLLGQREGRQLCFSKNPHPEARKGKSI